MSITPRSAQGRLFPSLSPDVPPFPPEEGNSPAAREVVHLVGKGERVLLLGPTVGHLLPLLRARDCQVTVAHSQSGPGLFTGDRPGGLDPEEGSPLPREREPFDVVVTAGALEEAADPAGWLRGVTGLLADQGSLIVIVPNAAHGSHRLTLLAGRIPPAQASSGGPARQAFTYRSLVQLFEDAGFALTHLGRHESPIEPADAGGPVSQAVLEALRQDPDARTATYVVVACPTPGPRLGWLREQFRILAEQQETATRQARELAAELEAVHGQLGQLLRLQEAAVGREGELHQRLLKAHRQLAQRDQELNQALRDLAFCQRDNGEARVEWSRVGQVLQETQAAWKQAEERWQAERQSAREHAEALEARLAAVRSSLAGRLYRLLPGWLTRRIA